MISMKYAIIQDCGHSQYADLRMTHELRANADWRYIHMERMRCFFIGKSYFEL